MSETPFMQLYVGDYLADTLDLTTEQHGAYLLLLMTMWRHGAKLPNDPAKLARIARVHPPRWSRVWAEISKYFEATEDGFITNSRLSKEHEKAIHKSRSRADAGAKGGSAKALKNKNQALANATDLSKQGQKSESEEKTEAKASAKKTGSRLPSDWLLPLAWGEWALAEGMSELCVRREADRFRDFWIGKAGKDAAKLDWQATWRNWIRKALQDQPKGRGRVGASGTPEIGEIRDFNGKRKQYAGNGTGWLVVHD